MDASKNHGSKSTKVSFTNVCFISKLFFLEKFQQLLNLYIAYVSISSLYTLIFALFGKTHRMSEELIKMKNMSASGMADYGLDFGMSTEAPMTKDCFNIPIPCQMLSRCILTKFTSA